MYYYAQQAFSQRLKRARHRLHPRASQARDEARIRATGQAYTSGSLIASARMRTGLVSCLLSSQLRAACQACCQQQIRRCQGYMGESARPWTGAALSRRLSVRLSLTCSHGQRQAAAQMVWRAVKGKDKPVALQDLAKQCALQYTVHAALARTTRPPYTAKFPTNHAIEVCANKQSRRYGCIATVACSQHMYTARASFTARVEAMILSPRRSPKARRKPAPATCEFRGTSASSASLAVSHIKHARDGCSILSRSN